MFYMDFEYLLKVKVMRICIMHIRDKGIGDLKKLG